MTKPKLLIRIAAGLILFFLIGHSMGHFTRHDVTDLKEKEVLQVMSNNQFDLFGETTTYDHMYTGMSMNLIFTLLAFTIILWHISNIRTENKKLATQLLLPVTLCVFGFCITSFLFFFPIPAITCLIAGVILTFAIIKLNVRQEK
jgi:hypothetical protein